MDDLNSILARKNFDEPPEIKIIKNYAQEKFQEPVNVLVKDREIIISSVSAGLIASLRMHGPDLTRLCQTDKKLVFRIG